MAQLLVRNIDAAVVDHFKARAKAAGRSLEAEVREVLTRAAAVPERGALVEAFDRIAREVGPIPGDWPDSTAMIREDRDSR